MIWYECYTNDVGEITDIESVVREYYKLLPKEKLYSHKLEFGDHYCELLSTKCTDFIYSDEQFVILGDVELHYVNVELKTKTEVYKYIIELFKEKGSNFVKDIYGEFSFVLIDKQRKSYYQYRDQIGVKSAYYKYSSLKSFHLASDLFIICKGGKKNIDNHAFISSFIDSLGVGDSKDTPYRNINKLKSAEYAVFTHESVDICNYWKLSSCESVHVTNYKEALTTLNNIVINAIKCRVEGSGEIAVSASGGLDSLGLYAICKSELKKKTTAFNGSFLKFKESDETEFVDSTMSMYSDACNYVNCDSAILLSDYPEGIMETYEPFISSISSCFPEKIISKIRKENYDLLLTGVGGDNLFTGSDLALSLTLSKGRIIKAIKDIFLVSKIRRSSFIPFLFSKVYEVINSIKFGGVSSKWRKQVEYNVNGLTKHTFIDRILGGKHLIDIKHPYMDRKLIEYMYNIPVDMLWKEGYTKVIQRELFYHRLPNKVVSRFNKTRNEDLIFVGLKENWDKIENNLDFDYILKNDLMEKETLELNLSKVRHGVQPEERFWMILIVLLWKNKIEEV